MSRTFVLSESRVRQRPSTLFMSITRPSVLMAFLGLMPRPTSLSRFLSSSAFRSIFLSCSSSISSTNFAFSESVVERKYCAPREGFASPLSAANAVAVVESAIRTQRTRLSTLCNVFFICIASCKEYFAPDKAAFPAQCRAAANRSVFCRLTHNAMIQHFYSLSQQNMGKRIKLFKKLLIRQRN